MATEISTEKRKAWAEKLGESDDYLYQCLTGRRDMDPARARRIEVDTDGELTRQMLCQKTWAGIWPDLQERLVA